MKRTLLRIAFLLLASTWLSTLHAQLSVNISPEALYLDAHYTAGWNNLSAINNGVLGYGELSDNETWASWSNDRPESGWLSYEWEEEYTINKSTVYFWTDRSDENWGDNVPMPSSWKIQYWDNSSRDWADVTLTGSQSYPHNRLAPNTVEFESVVTQKMRLYMEASTNGTTYGAFGVTEWEVYSSISEPSIILEPTHILLSEIEGKRSAVFTIKGVNLEEDEIEIFTNLEGLEFSPSSISKSDVETENGLNVTVTFIPENGETASGAIDVYSGNIGKTISIITSKDSECFTEEKGNLIYDPRFLSMDRLTTWSTLPVIVNIDEDQNVRCGATSLKFTGTSGIEMKNNIYFSTGTYKISGWIKTNGTFETGVYGTNGNFTSNDEALLEQSAGSINFLIPDTEGEWHFFEYTFNIENSLTGGTWINNDRSKTATLVYLDNWQLYKVGDEGDDDDELTFQEYPIEPVAFTEVKLTDAFWAPRIKTNQEVTIPIALQQCYETGRVDNFKKAGGLMEGYFSTEYPFDDTDIYKIIEGMAYSIQMYPNQKLEEDMDELIGYIDAAQEEDGYLFTARTAASPSGMHSWVGINRWEKDPDLSHELYNCGHLYEAAVAHYYATGKSSLLDIAIKNADLLVKDFLEGRLPYEPGHQIVEMGLVKMYRATGKKDYLELAKYFLDLRGNRGVARSEYSQSHRPVTEQDEAVGHAVRAVYMYSGMTDVAALGGINSYQKAVDTIWDNVVGKKYYITGGIGALHSGEAFGANYELPNASAYCETCAAIGNVYWNHRLFLLHGDAKFYDVIERTLYNGVVSGTSLSGDRFFYPNPLESEGQYSRSEWFGCACCPSNLCRFTASVPGYVYAQKGDSVYVNLFVQSDSELKLDDKTVRLAQTSNYPWEGTVSIEVTPEETQKFDILIRIPGWAQNRPVPSDLYTYLPGSQATFTITINGQTVEATVEENGYVTLSRNWQAGDKIELSLPMEIRRTLSHENVVTNEGKVSLERGPIVYCLEGPDNNNDVLNAVVEDNAAISYTYETEQLNGIVALQIEGKAVRGNDASQRLVVENKSLTAIPYYAWANREASPMAVWIARTGDYARLPLQTDTLTHKLTLKTFNGSLDGTYPSTPVEIDTDRLSTLFGIQASEITGAFGSSVIYAAIEPSGAAHTSSTAIHPGHWFNAEGGVTSWNNSSYLFSEFSLSNWAFNIGLFPNVCKEGDRFTIKQALIYTPASGSPARMVFVFNIEVSDLEGIEEQSMEQVVLLTSGNELYIKQIVPGSAIRIYTPSGMEVVNTVINSTSYSVKLPSGMYIVSVGENTRSKIWVP